MFAMNQTKGTTKWFERQRAKQSWESTWDKFAWYSYEKGIYYVYSLPCVLYFRSVRVSQIMTLKLKDLIADPDSTGTNDESWNPRTKPKGHYEICTYTQYISHAYQSKLSKNNMCYNFHFVIFLMVVQRNLIYQENLELSRKVQRIHQENVELYKKVRTYTQTSFAWIIN